MDSRYNLLIVDDDEIIHNLLSSYLTSRRYTVFSAFCCEDMDKYLHKQHIDGIILDVVMPGKNGFQCMQALSVNYPALPVLMLSSQDTADDRILGLEMGADDYLTKPFSVRELELRLIKLLGARGRSRADDGVQDSLILDEEQEQIMRNGAVVKLTNTETRLLALFFNNAGATFSRDDLSIALYGHEHNPFDRSLDAHINRLRKKIEENPKQPRCLKTVWGKGYRFISNDKSIYD